MNGDRIHLTGANGQGKSILTKLVWGDLEPTIGSVSKHVAVHAAYFLQTDLSDMIEQFGSQSAIAFQRKAGERTETGRRLEAIFY
jgi:ATPase subunit of ABC transporter with duplicated ATPase domains